MRTTSHPAAAKAVSPIAQGVPARVCYAARQRCGTLAFLALCSLVPIALQAQGSYEGVPIKKSPTEEDLVAQLRQAQQNNPYANLKTAEPSPPEKVYQPSNLLDRCEFISFNGVATLVPKGSIVKIPAEYENRRSYAQGSKIVSWSEFLVLNRGWVTTFEVTQRQAEGNEPFAETAASLLERTKMLVVATMAQAPTSVLPPTDTKDNAEPTLNQPQP